MENNELGDARTPLTFERWWILNGHGWEHDRAEYHLAKSAYESALSEAALASRRSTEVDWRKMGIVELAVENQSVSDYIEHWEGRALSAESKLAASAPQAGASPVIDPD